MTLENLRIFISYPRGGAAHTWAEAVQAHLECEGARAWRDETGVREGEQSWHDRIEGALRAADLVVAIVGMDSEICRWQKRELLTADDRRTPVVALRIDDRARMPFAIVENQPVEARPDQTATLAALVEAIGRAGQAPAPTPTPMPTRSASHTDSQPEAIPPDQRRAEIAWLHNLLHRKLTDRAALYVPLEGVEHSSPAAERVLKKVPIATESLFRAFGMAEAASRSLEVTAYADVLDAYRALGSRPVRRLAVLGEPGAGKSFSLERIALADADRAIHDELAPIPLLVPLGLWTREGESLEEFIARSLGGLGRHLPALIAQRRAVLLLDAINEIPPGQRRHKATQILALAHDQRLASVVVSCREKDFAEFSLPFDTLTLQPLSPPRVRDFLRRYHEVQMGKGTIDAADARFWQIAGGDAVRDAWEAWGAAGAEDLFWTADEIPRENLDVHSRTTWQQYQAWHRARFDPRSLLRLAANPYLLYIMAVLPDLPANRAQLFQGFLETLYEREHKARADRHDRRVPNHGQWLAALTELAELLQRLPQTAGSANEAGARTALPRAEWPATLDQDLLDFSRDASVLELRADALRFTHQLLQEYLASRLLLDASQGGRPAADFWPPARWWERSGWEVVAEIAVESCVGDEVVQIRLIAWIGEANPDVAADVWRHAGEPRLPDDVLSHFSARWLARMTDPTLEPQPRARAAIGRALGRLGLDHRRGVGLRHDGLPDIDWQWISTRSIAGSDGVPIHVAEFCIARYPVTNRQFQAFVEAGGYRDDRWWAGCKLRVTEPSTPEWDDPNAPRESVTEYEVKAYCNWLGSALGLPVGVPTEEQWTAMRSGPDGVQFPWGKEYRVGYANCREPDEDGQGSAIGRTTAVGLYPHGSSDDGVMDVVGNVAEWVVHPRPWSSDPRPLWPIGEGWDHKPGARDMAVLRYYADALKASTLGFRVCFVPECNRSHE
ncbi:MAG: TIR domain-containing protein [Betaproteobacteria bacterium]|nr:MAG: TIR domain-containing protein [Betaproteobacteria bacterium]